MVANSGEHVDYSALKIGIVGGGHMGQALLAGWVEGRDGVAASLGASNFAVANPGAEKRARIEERFGVTCFEDARSLSGCDVVVLCVKPQILFDVLRSMDGLDFMETALFLSPAAGVTCASLEAALPGNARVIRFMPNMPLAISRGVLPLSLGANATSEDKQLADELFSSVGSVYWIDESLMHAATAVSGSGPGYMAVMVDAMTKAGVEAGLDADVAEALARDTMEGTAAYMRTFGKHADVMRAEVALPGGTTEAAFNAMEQAGFDAAVQAGVAAAAARSAELAAQITE